jgi:hypothetical protein
MPAEKITKRLVESLIPRDRPYIAFDTDLLDPALLRADDFDAFMSDRQKRLLVLIQQATGKEAYHGAVQEEGEDIEEDPDAAEAELTIPVD